MGDEQQVTASVAFVTRAGTAVVFAALLCASAPLARSDAAARASSATPQATARRPSAVTVQAFTQRSLLIRVDVAASSPDGRTVEATVRRVRSAPANRRKLTRELVGKHVVVQMASSSACYRNVPNGSRPLACAKLVAEIAASGRPRALRITGTATLDASRRAFAVRRVVVPLPAATPRNGLLGTDPSFFPITVWLQEPLGTAAAYREIGINTFSGLHGRGPTNDRMDAIKAARMTVLLGGDHQRIGLASRHPDRIGAWLQRDEPDNAQPAPGGGYGPCVEPSVIVNEYKRFKRSGPSRPVVLNFGPGAAFTRWWGRGSCMGKVGMYADYARGADILSFDIYPTNNGWPLTYVAEGVDNLMRAGRGRKPVWAFVETTKYSVSNPAGPTPAQTRAQVWLALTHGATGIQYFVHIFSPGFVEAGLLQDPAMKRVVRATNGQIRRLAPVLNSPTLRNGVRVSASARLDTIAKRRNGSRYVFAVAPQAAGATATFTVAGLGKGTVTVIDENRRLRLRGGKFHDRFARYGVHLYKVADAR